MAETNALLRETVALQREVIAELRADKAQRGAVGTATIGKMDRLAEEVAAQKRATRAARAKEPA